MDIAQIIIGIFIGAVISSWVITSYYENEREKEKVLLRDVLTYLVGYEHLKNLIKKDNKTNEKIVGIKPQEMYK